MMMMKDRLKAEGLLALSMAVIRIGWLDWWDFLEEFHAPPRRHPFAWIFPRRAARRRMLEHLKDDAR